MTTQERQRRWYHLTPDRFFAGLLVVQVFLLLSEHFQWFAINEKKGWTVLIAVGVACVAVVVMVFWGLVCLCLRRRFQFGVRSLLLFVVAASVPLGWFAWEMQRARRQKEAVEKILESGGIFAYDYECDEHGNVIHLDKPPTPVVQDPRWLDYFHDVVSVGCIGEDFGDEDAVYLKELTDVKRLILICSLSDAGLVHIRGMTELETLYLGCPEFTGKSLAHLADMKNLEWLGFDYRPVADSDLKAIQELPSLNTLLLRGTLVSDAGLVHLERMESLEDLRLSESLVTNEGVKKLQQALPNCTIHHDAP